MTAMSVELAEERVVSYLDQISAYRRSPIGDAARRAPEDTEFALQLPEDILQDIRRMERAHNW